MLIKINKQPSVGDHILPIALVLLLVIKAESYYLILSLKDVLFVVLLNKLDHTSKKPSIQPLTHINTNAEETHHLDDNDDSYENINDSGENSSTTSEYHINDHIDLTHENVSSIIPNTTNTNTNLTDQTHLNPTIIQHNNPYAKHYNPRIRSTANNITTLTTNQPKPIIISKLPLTYFKIKAHPLADRLEIALKNEIQGLIDMKVWSNTSSIPLSDIPADIIPLMSTSIFDTIYNPDGTFKKDKSRIVIRGDFWKNVFNILTYAGTVRSETVRVLLFIAAILDLEIEGWDICQAFLYSDLKPNEEIYMKSPPGVPESLMPKIVKLDKCIYGLPQASAYFQEHLTSNLLKIGFKKLISDQCVFIKNILNTQEFIIISTHVDDLGVIASSQKLIDNTKLELQNIYKMTITLNNEYYLGLHIK